MTLDQERFRSWGWGRLSLWWHGHVGDTEDKIKVIKEEGRWECLQVGSQSSLMSNWKSWEPRFDWFKSPQFSVLEKITYHFPFFFFLSFFSPFTTSFFLSFPPPPFSLSLCSFSPYPIYFCSEWSRSQCQLGSNSSQSTLNYPVNSQIFEKNIGLSIV